MSYDFKIDLVSGDLDLDSGLTLETDETVVAAQRLKLALDINLGEWFADTDFGLPFIATESSSTTAQRYFLGDKASDLADFVQITIDDFIVDLDYIDAVESEYVFNPSTRQYNYTYEVVTSEGENISSSVTTTL